MWIDSRLEDDFAIYTVYEFFELSQLNTAFIAPAVLPKFIVKLQMHQLFCKLSVFLQVVWCNVSHPSDNCMIWTFTRNILLFIFILGGPAYVQILLMWLRLNNTT